MLISGCGEYKVAEFKSRDGQIRFVAVTPFECDESKPIEADVVGLPYKPARLHIRFVNCDYRFQVDELDAVEGQDWFALIAPRLLRLEEEFELADAVYCVVDRRTQRALLKLEDCADDIQSEVTVSLRDLRRSMQAFERLPTAIYQR